MRPRLSQSKRARQRRRGKRKARSVDNRLIQDELVFGNAFYWVCRKGRKHRIDPRSVYFGWAPRPRNEPQET